MKIRDANASANASQRPLLAGRTGNISFPTWPPYITPPPRSLPCRSETRPAGRADTRGYVCLSPTVPCRGTNRLPRSSPSHDADGVLTSALRPATQGIVVGLAIPRPIPAGRGIGDVPPRCMGLRGVRIRLPSIRWPVQGCKQHGSRQSRIRKVKAARPAGADGRHVAGDGSRARAGGRATLGLHALRLLNVPRCASPPAAPPAPLPPRPPPVRRVPPAHRGGRCRAAAGTGTAAPRAPAP